VSGSKRAGAQCKAHPFRLEVHQNDGLVHLCVYGDFDRAVVGGVQDALGAALEALPADGASGVVFDLSGVTFMDAGALEMILRTDQLGRRDGFGVTVVRPPPLVGRIFTLSKVTQRLSMVETGQAA
jgi:anti-anti-sigma factor